MNKINLFSLALAGILMNIGNAALKKGKGIWRYALASMDDFEEAVTNWEGLYEYDEQDDEARHQLVIDFKNKFDLEDDKAEKVVEHIYAAIVEIAAIIDTPQNEGDGNSETPFS